MYASKEIPRPMYLDTPDMRRLGVTYRIDLKFNLHGMNKEDRSIPVNIYN